MIAFATLLIYCVTSWSDVGLGADMEHFSSLHCGMHEVHVVELKLSIGNFVS